MNMTIGVDARHLNGAMHGTVRYTIKTMQHMVQSRRCRFVLLSNKPIVNPFENKDAVSIHIDSAFSWMPGAVWLAFRAGHLLCTLNVDAFWGPLHALPLCGMSDIPRIVTIHDLAHLYYPESMTWKNRIIHMVYFSRTVAKATRIIAVSQTTRNALKKEFGPKVAAKTSVIYEGKSDLPPSSRSPLIKGDYLLCIGSVEPRKNIAGAVEAFRLLIQDYPRLRLVVAGGHGWKQASLYKSIEKRGLSEKVQFTGRCSDAELSNYIAHAKIFLFPSLYEGFGLPLLETLGQCPAVISDIPIFRELGQHLSGLQFADFQQPSLAAAVIRRVLKETFAQKPEFASSSAARLLSWGTCASRHEDLFMQPRLH
ncbi:glycosyltransferase family 4 protein [Pseudodesulfovibrio methanolicus]|uniref:Glycosyltransferase family 1 protein n=1 Tax=Pseudodesulfovibrio methanolicus TaxID=3126690 RepID=A0ABZ2IYP6_9BACT